MKSKVINTNQKPLIIIGGATGVGKTDLSIRLAIAVNGSIISADSMQVFKGFDIGSAKIKPEEMQGVRHYLIDILEPDSEFNAFDFQRLAREAMEDIYSRGEIPIIVGGTGFYIQSVLYDIEFSEDEPDEEYRDELWKLSESKGAEFLHNMLKEVDPEAAEAIPSNNIKRVIRALEFYKSTGRRISEHNKEQRERISPYNYAYFVLNRPRDIVYERINRRVDIMIEEGLEREVRDLLEKGISPDCQAMKGLGYKEMCEYLIPMCHPEHIVRGARGASGRGARAIQRSEGSLLYNTIEECSAAIKQNTRHFAKRQITWFKREKDAIWINLEKFGSTDETLNYMLDVLKEKNIV